MNACEVIGELNSKLGFKIEVAKELVNGSVRQIIDFDTHQAAVAAELKTLTKPLGLSIGDLACISLGIILNLPIYTADRIWSQLESSANINLIR